MGRVRSEPGRRPETSLLCRRVHVCQRRPSASPTASDILACVFTACVHAIPSTHAQCLQNPEARPAWRLEPGSAALLLVLISLSVVSSPWRPWSWRENGRPGTTATKFVNVGTISATRIHATENKRCFISSAEELLHNYQQSQPRLGLEKGPTFSGRGGRTPMFVQTPEVKCRSGGSGAGLDPIREISLCHPQPDGQIGTGDFPTDAFKQKLNKGKAQIRTQRAPKGCSFRLLPFHKR